MKADTSIDGPINALLIEDDPRDARLFVERLRHFAPGVFNVTQARTLDAAIKEAAHTEFNVAVLDLTLPDSSGLDTFRRFREDQPGLPVIVLSGISDSEMGDTLRRTGAAAALVKADCRSEDIVSLMRSSASSTHEQKDKKAVRAAFEARFRNAVLDAADGIVVLDAQGNITLVSQSAERLLARPAADLVGTSLAAKLVPGEVAYVQAVHESTTRFCPSEHGGVTQQFDACSVRVLDLEIWPFAHAWAGQPVTVCALRDISGRSDEEIRLRALAHLEKPITPGETFEAACTEIAVRFAPLVRFNRFEVSIRGRKSENALVFELGEKDPAASRSGAGPSARSGSGEGAADQSRSVTEISYRTHGQLRLTLTHREPGQYGQPEQDIARRLAGLLRDHLERHGFEPAASAGVITQMWRDPPAADQQMAA